MAADLIDLNAMRIDPTDPTLKPAVTTKRGGFKVGRYFVKVPLGWLQVLDGAPGQTYALALRILHLSFREHGAIKVTSRRAGMPPQSRRRALHDLEARGLVTVDWHVHRAPTVRIAAGWN